MPESDLAYEMRKHIAEPFPESVEKGEDYGEVDPVMIGADIYGWASTVSSGGKLSSEDRSRLKQAGDELERSLTAFPADAHPYYERILRVAHLALGDAPVRDEPLPKTVTLDDAFRAAYYMTEQYVALESHPDEGLVLFQQYLASDPARWDDWKAAVRRAMQGESATDPLAENLYRPD